MLLYWRCENVFTSVFASYLKHLVAPFFFLNNSACSATETFLLILEIISIKVILIILLGGGIVCFLLHAAPPTPRCLSVHWRRLQKFLPNAASSSLKLVLLGTEFFRRVLIKALSDFLWAQTMFRGAGDRSPAASPWWRAACRLLFGFVQTSVRTPQCCEYDRKRLED